VHDILDILGVPDGASGTEVRRACARRTRRSHPDFARATIAPVATPTLAAGAELAIDFVDMAVFIDAIQTAFFADDH
jgi:hypothetical protein